MKLFFLSILFCFSAHAADTVTGYSVTSTITTSPSVGLSSALVIGSNPARKGFTLWNNSANSAYVTFGSTSSSANCSLILASFTSFTWTLMGNYVGPISAIRNSGSGTITITEFQ